MDRLLPRIDKSLLHNVIRHTDAHNKYVETQEMWRQRQKEVRGRGSSRQNYLSDGDSQASQSRSPVDARDEEREVASFVREIMNEPRLVKTDRWGHDGYSTLYGGGSKATDGIGPPTPEIPRKKIPGPSFVPRGEFEVKEKDAKSKKRKREKEPKRKKKKKKFKKEKGRVSMATGSSSSQSDVSDSDDARKARRKKKKKSDKT